MRKLSLRAAIALVLVVAIAAAAVAAERRRRQRPGHGKTLQQIEQQMRASRNVTKRIQRDPRASAEIKRQATELETLLDTRERTLAKLDSAYRDFLARHKTELDELEGLRKRALAIDQKLGDARTVLVEANRPEIDELQRSSTRARELVENLRSSYDVERRSRRQR
jgi:hypothetical protein